MRLNRKKKKKKTYSEYVDFEEASTLRVASPRDSFNQKDQNGDARNGQLPCVASAMSSDDKARVSSPRAPGAKRKLLSRLSFKFKDGHNNQNSCECTFFFIYVWLYDICIGDGWAMHKYCGVMYSSCLSTVIVPPKVLLQRPKAGSSLSFCPLEKKMSNSWSPIESSTFRVRGQNYLRWEQSLFICIMFLISLNCFILLSFSFACNVLHYSFLHLNLSIKSTFHLFYRDKKKDFAPNFAAYCPFAADVFLSQRKIDHIARFVDLPVIDSSEELPSILVVNLQVFLLFSFFLFLFLLFVQMLLLLVVLQVSNWH